MHMLETTLVPHPGFGNDMSFENLYKAIILKHFWVGNASSRGASRAETGEAPTGGAMCLGFLSSSREARATIRSSLDRVPDFLGLWPEGCLGAEVARWSVGYMRTFAIKGMVRRITSQ